MVFPFRKRLKLHSLYANLKKLEKHRLALAYNCLAKEMQHVIFHAHAHACSPSYTSEE